MRDHLWPRHRALNNSSNAHALATEAPDLLALLRAYLAQAKPYYANDRLGASRMVLTAHALVAVVEAACRQTHPQLQQHKTALPPIGDLRRLLLPERADMAMLAELEALVAPWQSTVLRPSSLDSTEFAAAYAAQTTVNETPSKAASHVVLIILLQYFWCHMNMYVVVHIRARTKCQHTSSERVHAKGPVIKFQYFNYEKTW